MLTPFPPPFVLPVRPVNTNGQDLDACAIDHGKMGRQIMDLFDRAVEFHKWNVGPIEWQGMD